MVGVMQQDILDLKAEVRTLKDDALEMERASRVAEHVDVAEKVSLSLSALTLVFSLLTRIARPCLTQLVALRWLLMNGVLGNGGDQGAAAAAPNMP
jgi:hypothetical protein